MDLLGVLATLVFAILACGFGIVFLRLTSRERFSPPPEEWEGLFSPGRYKAMERLLDETDRQFLWTHPRFCRSADKRFRDVRVKIFRGYMQQLGDDFNRICKALKGIMAHSEVDRPDLAGLLLKHQFTFTFAMMTIEVKLMLYSSGFSGNDTRALLAPLAHVRAQLQSLAAVADPAVGMSRA
jgi:hypothetical protein